MTAETVGIISILLFELLIGISPVVYKAINPAVPSSVVVAIRFIFACITLFAWKLLSGQLFSVSANGKKWKTILAFIFLGAFGSGVASIANVVAIRNIGAILGTLLTNLELPLGIVFGVIFLKEKLAYLYIKLFIIICLGYILLIVKNGIQLPSGGSYITGVSVALVAALIWGACTVVAKKLLVNANTPINMTFWRMLFASFMNIGIVTATGAMKPISFTTIRGIDWIYLIWLGAVTSGVGYVLYYKALHVLSVKKVSVFFPVSTIISVVLAVGTGELPIFSQWIGIVLIVGGMAFLLLKKRHI